MKKVMPTRPEFGDYMTINVVLPYYTNVKCSKYNRYHFSQHLTSFVVVTRLSSSEWPWRSGPHCGVPEARRCPLPLSIRRPCVCGARVSKAPAVVRLTNNNDNDNHAVPATLGPRWARRREQIDRQHQTCTNLASAKSTLH